eukprot:2759322-Pleurochrysis_carterae.AAC.1
MGVPVGRTSSFARSGTKATTGRTSAKGATGNRSVRGGGMSTTPATPLPWQKEPLPPIPQGKGKENRGKGATPVVTGRVLG